VVADAGDLLKGIPSLSPITPISPLHQPIKPVTNSMIRADP